MPGMLLIVDIVKYERSEEEIQSPSFRGMAQGASISSWACVGHNAAADPTKNVLQEMISDFHEYDHEWKNGDDYYINATKVRVLKDFVVCDPECGYCGCCEY